MASDAHSKDKLESDLRLNLIVLKAASEKRSLIT